MTLADRSCGRALPAALHDSRSQFHHHAAAVSWAVLTPAQPPSREPWAQVDRVGLVLDLAMGLALP